MATIAPRSLGKNSLDTMHDNHDVEHYNENMLTRFARLIRNGQRMVLSVIVLFEILAGANATQRDFWKSFYVVLLDCHSMNRSRKLPPVLFGPCDKRTVVGHSMAAISLGMAP